MILSSTNLDKLQKLQNNALRLVLGLPPRSHNISVRLRECHWLPVKNRIVFKYLTTIFKCVNCLAPVQLAQKIRLECPINMVLISGYRPSSVFGKRAFSYLAPRFWNAMPCKLRVIPALEQFKVNLKTYLFDNLNELLHRVNPYTSFAISQPEHSVFTNERIRFSALERWLGLDIGLQEKDTYLQEYPYIFVSCLFNIYCLCVN